MTERRAKMVQKAFNILDREGSGVVSVKDISKCLSAKSLVSIYDVSMNPEFIEGKKSKEQILTEFLNNFEGARGNHDG